MTVAVYFEKSSGKALVCMSGPEGAEFPEPADTESVRMLDDFVELPGYFDDDIYVHVGTPPSPNLDFNYTTKQWEDPRTLQDRKAEKWAHAKAERDAQEFGPFSWGAFTFDGDAESKSRLSLAAMAAQAAIASGQVWEVDWTLADNSTVTLSAADVIGVVQAMGANITAAHQAARLKRAAIEAATTVEELDAI